MPRVLAVLFLTACAGCNDEPTETPTPTEEERTPVSLRVATYNTSLYGDAAGQIASRLAGDDDQARGVAEVLQHVRPDVVLLNELDYAAGNAEALASAYLAVGQNGLDPLDYPYVYAAPSNTGVHSGFDLDDDGTVTSTPGSQAYGNDAWGYGTYEGQYGFAVFSRFPIEDVRTFQTFRWADMPDHVMPPGWFDTDEAAAVRLSSKNHVDLSIRVGDAEDQVLHLLASHPTPPSFDGPEDRNGRRNHDEIRFFADYLDGGADSYHVDDEGVQGGLGGSAHFVVVGDLNADPADGGSREGAITQLTEHPLVNDPLPTSEGAAEQAENQGGANDDHTTPAAQDTADFEDRNVGNLRIDYALPSTSLTVDGAGVFWPLESDPAFSLIGTFPYPISDHRPVWVDVTVP